MIDPLQMVRPEQLTQTWEQARALAPFYWVFGGCGLAILAAVVKKASRVPPRWPAFIVTLITLAGGAYLSIDRVAEGAQTLFSGMLVSDAFANVFNAVFLLCGLFSVIASFKYLDREGMHLPEYYILLLFSAFGMMLLSASLDLIVLFIALELMSISVYVLVGFRRADRRSNEAAVKYFILGSAASAIMLYGAAMLYGATGSTSIQDISIWAQSHAASPLFVIGAWLVVLGFLFKVAAAPFHMWMPDVYEGAPVPITGFMTTALKAAAFATFLRVFVSLHVQVQLHDLLWVVAVATMIIGNVIALTQTNLKRMLAYSSIAHSGYLLTGFLSGAQGTQGYFPIVVYLISYAVMNLGAFIVLTLISDKDDAGLNLHDLSGMARRYPLLSLCLAVFMFSMAGIPPTAGFAAKYLIFYGAVQAGELPLVVIGVLCSAISVYYYLRVLVYLYMRESAGTPSAKKLSLWPAVAAAVLGIMTLQMGLIPSRIVLVAQKAIASL